MTVTSTARYGGSAYGRGPWGGRTPGAPIPPVPPDTLDAYSVDPGSQAGRIEPVEITPADGQFVFCLGHDLPGFLAFVQPGEYDEIAQQETLPNDSMLTFQARTRGPVAAPPAGYEWVAQVLVDGSIVSSRNIDAGNQIDWDWTIDLVGLADTTSHTIAFRLAFTGPALPGPPGLPVLETEIPAFYIDNLVFFGGVVPGSGAIVNEVPTNLQGESAGTAPPRTTAIDFDVFGNGTNIDSTTIHVTVNGVDAIVAGVAQAGYTSTIGSPGEIVHVHLVPNAAFASNELVTVFASAGALTLPIIGGFSIGDGTLIAADPLGIPRVTAVTPPFGNNAGGDFVEIVVNNSAGATTASVCGVPVIGFAIIDTVTVSGTTQAMPTEVGDVTVTNGFGTGTLTGGFTSAPPISSSSHIGDFDIGDGTVIG